MRAGRVVVAVSPRLLGDVLCRSLAEQGMAVLSVDAAPFADEVYDVGVVSAGREGEVHAAHVITLPPDDEAGDFGLGYLRRTLDALLQDAGD